MTKDEKSIIAFLEASNEMLLQRIKEMPVTIDDTSKISGLLKRINENKATIHRLQHNTPSDVFQYPYQVLFLGSNHRANSFDTESSFINSISGIGWSHNHEASKGIKNPLEKAIVSFLSAKDYHKRYYCIANNIAYLYDGKKLITAPATAMICTKI